MEMPEMIFNPKKGKGERIVLRNGSRSAPNPEETVPAAQG
jgi:hypothetical protein